MISGEQQIQFFESALFETTGYDIQVQHIEFLSGGCINNAVKLNTSQGPFFIKSNVHELEGMFEAEARGLKLLRDADEIHIPEVIGYGRLGDQAYLILEFIQESLPKAGFWENFGHSLAGLHRHEGPSFGLDFDNYIGSLAQVNQPMANGIAFFAEKRIKAQAGLAFYDQKIDGPLFDKIKKFCEQLPDLIPADKASLLHGDLWSGNFMTNKMGEVTLIDPAVYYGLREVELAFTHLFGGFDPQIYQAYQESYPLEPDFPSRIEIYNLYPLLVHLNLFGSGYLAGIERVIYKYVGK